MINHYEILDVSDAEEGWWNLLKRLLEEEEVGKQSVLHHAVATELLNYSTSLPTWLSDSYKVSLGIGFGIFGHSLVHSQCKGMMEGFAIENIVLNTSTFSYLMDTI